MAPESLPIRRDDAGDDDIAITGQQPLLPEGRWFEARYLGHDTSAAFKAAKVYLRFRIVEAGDYFGVGLVRPFRARKLIGRPGPSGRFTLHARSDLTLTLLRLYDVKLRLDRISLRDLRHMLLRVRTRTVRINHERQPTPSGMHYSVINQVERGE